MFAGASQVHTSGIICGEESKIESLLWIFLPKSWIWGDKYGAKETNIKYQEKHKTFVTLKVYTY